MSKETAVIALGVFVVVVPFLGFPEGWRIVLLVLAGLGLAVLGFLIRAEMLSRGAGGAHNSFVENTHANVPHGDSTRQGPLVS